jgi:hypothetical protein
LSRFLLLAAVCALMSGCLAAPNAGMSSDSIGTGASAGVDAGAKDVARNFGGQPKTTRPVSLASAIPAYAVEMGCKATSNLSGSGGYKDCVEQELAAKDKLNSQWKGYSIAARQECTPRLSDDPLGSYVELLTCFEIRDWAAHPESGGVTGNGSTAPEKGAATQAVQTENSKPITP